MTTYAEYTRALWADRKLSSTQKLVAANIAHHAEWKTGQRSHPGNALIAEETGLSEISVKRAIPELVSQGWLFRTYNGRGASSKKASEYALKLPDTMILCQGDEGIQSITESVQSITEDTSKYQGDTTSTPDLPLTTSFREEKVVGGKKGRKITKEDNGLSSVPPSSSAPSVASSVPENAARTYVYWESRDVPGTWFVFPVGKALRAPKSAQSVTLSAQEDEFYQKFFRGGKEINRSRAEFLTGSPEERAGNIEYIRDRPELHPMTDDEYNEAA